MRSLGIDWDVLRQTVQPDQFAVYSGSAMGQLDFNGTGGMMQAALMGKRVTSKQLPLGLCEMPADFINAYVLGSLGATGATIGACATFLYNLRQGVEDIQSGRRRVVMVGNSEAPITPEIIEGYRTMGALAEDEALMAARRPHRRARQPARVPAVLRQLRLHAVGSGGLHGADGRCARARTRPDDSRLRRERLRQLGRLQEIDPGTRRRQLRDGRESDVVRAAA